MTPHDLKILIHHYVSPERHENWNSPAYKVAVDSMIQAGILVSKENGYADDYVPSNLALSDRGMVYMEHILTRPWPTEKVVWEFGA